ncbi:MAG: 2-thiouracil desulfurase family protein [bacterium]
MKDNRSKYFVFVPFCLLAQAFQAEGLVKYEWKSTIKPFVELLLKYDINIIQMPCPETNNNVNIKRNPLGLSKYDNLEFNNHTEELTNEVSKQVENILKNGYEVLAILGIEQSPSCCVNYIYTNKGMVNRKGLYMEKLYKKIENKKIPFIGINRKYIKKSLNSLEKIIIEAKKKE